jgi:DNA-binding MarR family transcriptional regulator
VSADAFDRRVLARIAKDPGTRCIEVAAAFGVDTVDVTRSLYRLKRAGLVKAKGNTRATTYTVAK